MCCTRSPKAPNARGGGYGFREVQGGHKEKDRKTAFSEVDREVKRAGETETRPKETETDIHRGQVETEQINEGEDQETERDGGERDPTERERDNDREIGG